MTPGKTFRDCGQCPEMVVIPTGTFQMGDVSSNYTSERPVHRVTIDYLFAVGKYEVTKGEFARFVEATGYVTKNTCYVSNDVSSDEGWEKRSGFGWRNPGYARTDWHPVVCVSWTDAREYVEWLSRKTGKFYRLLSEAEWEYMARAGRTTRYWWGNDIGTDKANCRDCGSQWELKSAAPVGSFAANAFGVFDTVGNVWEWVEDCFNDNYEGAPTNGRVWTSGFCGKRMLRGGSWYCSPQFVRPAFRIGNFPGLRSYDVGFRVARTLTP